jgi:hypothetical protein
MAKKEAELLLRIREKGSEILDMTKIKIAAIGAALIAFGKQAFDAFAESEQASNRLNQSLVQQGIYSKDLAKQYRDMASALQEKTTFDDDAIVKSQATLQMYLGETKITKELMEATLDLAQAKGMDLNQAAELVGKSIGTSTNALARQGVEMDTAASKAEKLAAVTDKLNRKFGGQAEAAALGTGAIKLMGNAVGDLMERIGGVIAPAIEFVALKIKQLSNALNENYVLWDVLRAGVFGITTIFSALEYAIKATIVGFINLFTGLGSVMQAIIDRDFSQIPKIIANHWTDAKDYAVKANQEMLNDIEANHQRHLEIAAENYGSEEELLRQSLENRRNIQAEADLIKDEDFAIKSEEEINKLMLHEQLKDDIQFQRLVKDEQMAATKEQKLKAQLAKTKFMEEQYEADRRKRMDIADQFDAIMQDKRAQRMQKSLGDLAAMQNSKNKELVAIGKAAAMAQIAINTAAAVMNVWGWASAIPFVGPALAVGLSAAIIAHGAEQISNVNSAQMAEGGIVTARPGGMLATIGEGGSDEAVIPLYDDRARERLGGGGITIHVYGGMLGDEGSAREFAQAVDKELYKLSKSNGSLFLEGRA